MSETEEINRKLIKSIEQADSEKLSPRRRIHVRGWNMNQRHRKALSDILSGPSGFIRSRIRFSQGKTRLIMPPIPEGGDPLCEWKAWGRRVEKALGGGRIPGNWSTRRGIKKRQRWLWNNFGHY